MGEFGRSFWGSSGIGRRPKFRGRTELTLKNKKVKRAVELFRNALRFRRRLDLNAADFDALTVGKDRAPKSGLDRPVRSAGRDAA